MSFSQMTGVLSPDERTPSDLRFSRRLRRLEITPDCLLAWLSQGETVPVLVANPLPADVKIVRAGYELERDVFLLLLESETFGEVAEGDRIPHVSPDPVFRGVPRRDVEPLL